MEFNFNLGKSRQAICSLIILSSLFLIILEWADGQLSFWFSEKHIGFIIFLFFYFGLIFLLSKRLYYSYKITPKIYISDTELQIPTLYLGTIKIKLADIYSIEKIFKKKRELLLLGINDCGGQLIDCQGFISMNEYSLFKKLLKSRTITNLDKKNRETINFVITKSKGKIPTFTYFVSILCMLFYFLEFYGKSPVTGDSVFLELGVGSKILLQGKDFYRVFSSSLLHANFLHLAVNIFAFSILGELLEKVISHLRMVNVFLASTIFGYFCFTLFSDFEYGAGLSGGVFGLFGAYVALRVRYEKFLPGSLSMMPLPRVLLVLALELMVEYLFLDNIDHFNHIGGFIAGFLYLYFAPLGPKLETIDQPVMAEKILCGGLILAFSTGLGYFLFLYYGLTPSA